MEEKKIYGYVRCSSIDQNEDRQMIALREAAVHEKNIFVDKQSGKDFDRPNYKKLLKGLKAGISFLSSVLTGWGAITRKSKTSGASSPKRLESTSVLDMPLLDTRNGKDLMGTFIADLVLQILSFVI